MPLTGQAPVKCPMGKALLYFTGGKPCEMPCGQSEALFHGGPARRFPTGRPVGLGCFPGNGIALSPHDPEDRGPVCFLFRLPSAYRRPRRGHIPVDQTQSIMTRLRRRRGSIIIKADRPCGGRTHCVPNGTLVNFSVYVSTHIMPLKGLLQGSR